MSAHQGSPPDVSCVVCGTVNDTTWRFPTVDGMHLSIARCRKCGHVYQCPRTDKSYADAFYAKAYAPGGEDHPYFDPALKVEHGQELLKVVGAQCPGTRRVLEVGAGMGAFAKVAKDAGLQVVGSEMSERAVRRARELFGVELYLGPVEDLPKTDPFDVAVLWDVIEHCPHPDSVLGAARDRLRPGGWVLLTTGNYECANRLVAGSKWWCWHPDHYHYFSPDGMSRLGRRLGLTEFSIHRSNPLQAPAPENVARPSPARFLNPLHVARGLRNRARLLWARSRWPNHWDIGVMLCRMTKNGEEKADAR